MSEDSISPNRVSNLGPQAIVDIIGRHIPKCSTRNGDYGVYQGGVQELLRNSRDVIVDLLQLVGGSGTFKGKPLIYHYLTMTRHPDVVILKAFKNVDWIWKGNDGKTVLECLEDKVSENDVQDLLLREANHTAERSKFQVNLKTHRNEFVVCVYDWKYLMYGQFGELLEAFLETTKSDAVMVGEFRRTFPQFHLQYFSVPICRDRTPRTIIRILVEHFKYDLNDTFDGKTLLQSILENRFGDWHVSEQFLHTLRFILEVPLLEIDRKCVPNNIELHQAMTPLEYALRSELFEDAVLLIKAGANVALIDTNHLIAIASNPYKSENAVYWLRTLGFHGVFRMIKERCDCDDLEKLIGHHWICNLPSYENFLYRMKAAFAGARVLRPLLEIAALAIRRKMNQVQAHRYVQEVMGIDEVPEHISKILKLQHRDFEEEMRANENLLCNNDEFDKFFIFEDASTV